jgi:hypothetical protein
VANLHTGYILFFLVAKPRLKSPRFPHSRPTLVGLLGGYEMTSTDAYEILVGRDIVRKLSVARRRGLKQIILVAGKFQLFSLLSLKVM